jgi:CitB family two-component system response regulator MalR/two-component system response regulator DctR
MIKAIIVEDDPMVAQINKHYLSEFKDIKVIGIFANGRDALNFLLSNSIDLLILDITMPLMNGLELARALREKSISTDIIAVTAASDIEHLDEMLRYGVIDYLVKPFDRSRFNKSITKFLKKANLFSRQSELNQDEIDLILNVKSDDNIGHEKGIQTVTLDKIKSFIELSTKNHFSCDNLAQELNLSKVTVRRYLNYLVEKEYLISTIDYETGGRPSIIYKIKNK